MATVGKVVIIPSGIKEMEREDLGPWLQRILESDVGYARQFVNVDTGRLVSSITTAISLDPLEGELQAHTNYALWQELEPDDQSRYEPVTTTTSIVRRRRGGRAYLRPGALLAIREHT
jgi:hypothetical protein